ncbi:DNA-binding protein [Corynebacterium hindlerae]|uniref:DNA-binding protein n=1 Tax=Corynebacterium hindlerae TaxID=699041 RepID=A0A7G5FEG4_9CORY|nr:Rv2175c family DNA-binding protein [Corynebacterium hindlerae]QMV85005.1 DNA-binding protein [Corynebacterium hindlerae]QTH59099.1 DNA-binding protein [Corynebacterium hindlerae]
MDVSSIPSAHDVLPADEPVLSVPDFAEKMGVVVTRVMHLLRDHQLIAVKRDGVKYIPARFLSDDGQLVKFVPGVIALLSDGGFTDDEILRYLFTEDDSLPGRPVDALHGHLAREVMRRAQSMGF